MRASGPRSRPRRPFGAPEDVAAGDVPARDATSGAGVGARPTAKATDGLGDVQTDGGYPRRAMAGTYRETRGLLERSGAPTGFGPRLLALALLPLPFVCTASARRYAESVALRTRLAARSLNEIHAYLDFRPFPCGHTLTADRRCRSGSAPVVPSTTCSRPPRAVISSNARRVPPNSAVHRRRSGPTSLSILGPPPWGAPRGVCLGRALVGCAHAACPSISGFPLRGALGRIATRPVRRMAPRAQWPPKSGVRFSKKARMASAVSWVEKL